MQHSTADGWQLGKQKLVHLASLFQFALTIKRKGVGEAREQGLPVTYTYTSMCCFHVSERIVILVLAILRH